MFLFIILIVIPIVLIVTSNLYNISELLKVGVIWLIISVIIIFLYFRNKREKLKRN